jgi:hypothetical protein
MKKDPVTHAGESEDHIIDQELSNMEKGMFEGGESEFDVSQNKRLMKDIDDDPHYTDEDSSDEELDPETIEDEAVRQKRRLKKPFNWMEIDS